MKLRGRLQVEDDELQLARARGGVAPAGLGAQKTTSTSVEAENIGVNVGLSVKGYQSFIQGMLTTAYIHIRILQSMSFWNDRCSGLRQRQAIGSVSLCKLATDLAECGGESSEFISGGHATAAA